MLLSHELLWQQLRPLYAREWHASHALARSRRHCCQRRYPGGQERHSGHELPTDNGNWIVPLLHIWLRLDHRDDPTSCQWQRRLRLEQRPVLENLCQFIALRWHSFFRRMCPVSGFAEAATQTARSMRRKFTERHQKNNWLGAFIKRFKWISRKLEKALIPVGSAKSYRNSSAAMELMDLTDIFGQLNSAIVDYLLNDDEYMKGISGTLFENL